MYIVFTDYFQEGKVIPDLTGYNESNVLYNIPKNGYYYDSLYFTSLIILDINNYEQFYNYYTSAKYKTYLFIKALQYINIYKRNQKLLAILK